MTKDEYYRILSYTNSNLLSKLAPSNYNVQGSYASIKIDSAKWLDYSIEQFDLADQKVEMPRSHYTGDGKQICEINNQLGRNEGNTFELSYGMQEQANRDLIALLGTDNLKILGIQQFPILIKLIVHFPGHGAAWHKDSADSFILKFPQYKDNKKQLIRYWFPVCDWKNGQVFQIGNSVLSHWSAGDVYAIPFGIGHASSNFGYDIKYSVSLTGITKHE